MSAHIYGSVASNEAARSARHEVATNRHFESAEQGPPHFSPDELAHMVEQFKRDHPTIHCQIPDTHFITKEGCIAYRTRSFEIYGDDVLTAIMGGCEGCSHRDDIDSSTLKRRRKNYQSKPRKTKVDANLSGWLIVQQACSQLNMSHGRITHLCDQKILVWKWQDCEGGKVHKLISQRSVDEYLAKRAAEKLLNAALLDSSV